MEKLVQLFHAMRAEATQFAWTALGFVLSFLILMASVTVFWIFTGGLRAGSRRAPGFSSRRTE
jgi:hypothetical protein